MQWGVKDNKRWSNVRKYNRIIPPPFDWNYNSFTQNKTKKISLIFKK